MLDQYGLFAFRPKWSKIWTSTKDTVYENEERGSVRYEKMRKIRWHWFCGIYQGANLKVYKVR